MNLMVKLAIYCSLIAGKLASVDGPYRDKCGRIVYRLDVKGQHTRWLRSHAAALKLAEKHNDSVRRNAEAQTKVLLAELGQSVERTSL